MDQMNTTVVVSANLVRQISVLQPSYQHFGYYIKVLISRCPFTSTTGQFQCTSGGRCIEMNQVCDGTPQCLDKSDEAGCWKPSRNCSMRCDWDTHCVPEVFVCNGNRDCLDGTDEANCGEPTVLLNLGKLSSSKNM